MRADARQEMTRPTVLTWFVDTATQKTQLKLCN